MTSHPQQIGVSGDTNAFSHPFKLLSYTYSSVYGSRSQRHVPEQPTNSLEHDVTHDPQPPGLRQLASHRILICVYLFSLPDSEPLVYRWNGSRSRPASLRAMVWEVIELNTWICPVNSKWRTRVTANPITVGFGRCARVRRLCCHNWSLCERSSWNRSEMVVGTQISRLWRYTSGDIGVELSARGILGSTSRENSKLVIRGNMHKLSTLMKTFTYVRPSLELLWSYGPFSLRLLNISHDPSLFSRKEANQRYHYARIRAQLSGLTRTSWLWSVPSVLKYSMSHLHNGTCRLALLAFTSKEARTSQHYMACYTAITTRFILIWLIRRLEFYESDIVDKKW